MRESVIWCRALHRLFVSAFEKALGFTSSWGRENCRQMLCVSELVRASEATCSNEADEVISRCYVHRRRQCCVGIYSNRERCTIRSWWPRYASAALDNRRTDALRLQQQVSDTPTQSDVSTRRQRHWRMCRRANVSPRNEQPQDFLVDCSACVR